MRRVRINCSVSYAYEVDVPDNINLTDDENVLIAVGSADPVYHVISNVLRTAKLEYNGMIDSVIDNDTGEIFYMR